MFEKIFEKLSMIKSYMKLIEDSQKEIANLLLEIELEVHEQDAANKKYANAYEKRTPEVQRFLDYIDKVFGKDVK